MKHQYVNFGCPINCGQKLFGADHEKGYSLLVCWYVLFWVHIIQDGTQKIHYLIKEDRNALAKVCWTNKKYKIKS